MALKSIVRNRTKAFVQQACRCCYCGAAMWTSHAKLFAKTYGLTKRQARQFRCTAEHKIARRDGGPNTPENIAAACLRCNHSRHAGREPMTAGLYRDFVDLQVYKGEWTVVGPHLAEA